MNARPILIWPCLLALSACSGNQSILNPAADQAALSETVWRTMLVVCGVMYILVMGFLGWALLRARRRLVEDMTPAPGHTAAEPKLEKTLTGWSVLIVAGLTLLVAVSFFVDRQLAQAGPAPLKVRVTAKQWWWKVEYTGDNPYRQVTTANELHLPLGRGAEVELQAGDVIHSFWVPNLSGKVDLVPGRTNHLVLSPRRTGTFRGQCAEFCGLQHAKMAFTVVVEPPEAFAKWQDAQLKPAAPPTDYVGSLGQHVFKARGCANCHKIGGTDAGGVTGPDLTHVASRPTIAAGTLPNNEGSLAGWIADPQGIKPGTQMPKVPLTNEELTSVVAYLETLK